VRALRVVIDPPFLDDFAGFTDAGEPVLVQAVLAVSAVEALDVGVLGRFSGIDEIELDAMIIGPSIERAPAQFRAVIDDQDIGGSTLSGHAFQHLHDPLTRQREVHLDGIRHCRSDHVWMAPAGQEYSG
jgi:hypothetical protein